jgi:CarD family transcriptional regulator
VAVTSPAVPKPAAPVPTPGPAMTSRPAAAPKPAAETKAPVAKSGVHRTGFKANEFIVYPAHGVGQIVAIEEQEVAGFKLELFVISFAKDKMTLKVPLPKVLNGAIRKLAEPETAKRSLDTLTGRARVKRTMWSRRAQEYEAKINSGDLVAIAEVVRDLYRSDAQPEQSYSERQLYEAALDRMGREIAAVEKLTETEALKLMEAHLQRGPRRGARGEAGAEADEAVEDGEVEEAA